MRKTHLFRADEYICSQCGASCDKLYKVCPSRQPLMGEAKYDLSWVDEAESLSVILDDDW